MVPPIAAFSEGRSKLTASNWSPICLQLFLLLAHLDLQIALRALLAFLLSMSSHLCCGVKNELKLGRSLVKKKVRVPLSPPVVQPFKR